MKKIEELLEKLLKRLQENPVKEADDAPAGLGLGPCGRGLRRGLGLGPGGSRIGGLGRGRGGRGRLRMRKLFLSKSEDEEE